MAVTKLAAVLTVIGVVIAAVGVGFYDWRAGTILFGLCMAAAGIWTLKE